MGIIAYVLSALILLPPLVCSILAGLGLVKWKTAGRVMLVLWGVVVAGVGVVVMMIGWLQSRE